MPGMLRTYAPLIILSGFSRRENDGHQKSNPPPTPPSRRHRLARDSTHPRPSANDAPSNATLQRQRRSVILARESSSHPRLILDYSRTAEDCVSDCTVQCYPASPANAIKTNTTANTRAIRRNHNLLLTPPRRRNHCSFISARADIIQRNLSPSQSPP